MLSINKTLIKTQFEQELCEAAFDNLQTKSKLRFNNFAYSIRELSRHILHRLAPLTMYRDVHGINRQKMKKV